MAIVVTILMYTVSLVLQLPAYVTIYNQCSNTKLISPVYFGNGVVCPKLSNQQIDIDVEMNASFEMNATQDEFEGALLYKLQRYSDGQNDMGTLATETNRKEATHVYMLAAWKVEDSKHFIYVVLVEHTKEFTWNEYKLRKLYMNLGRLKKCGDDMSDAWLIDDNIMLIMSFKARGLKRNFELSISISEKEKVNDPIRPLCVDLER
jgi:hypothetical protein